MNKTRISSWVIIIVIVIGLIVLSRFQFFSSFIDIILTPVRPIQARIFKTTTQANDFFTNIFLAAQLEKEIKRLSEQVVELSKENVQAKSLVSENASLRELLDFKESNRAAKLTLARVIGKSAFESAILIIDKGAFHGLKAGDPVITENGILLGKLIKTDQFSSQLMLLTDTRSEISASLSKANRQSGIIVGQRGLSLKFQLIPSDEDLKIGDLVVTSGLENEIPYGLLIGEIEEIKKIPNELFQEAIVKTLVPLHNVLIVATIQK